MTCSPPRDSPPDAVMLGTSLRCTGFGGDTYFQSVDCLVSFTCLLCVSFTIFSFLSPSPPRPGLHVSRCFLPAYVSLSYNATHPEGGLPAPGPSVWDHICLCLLSSKRP